jgi:ABC-2 type transport system ATP-binding protein
MTISVKNLSKAYPVAIKQPGLVGQIQHLWHRKYRTIEAVKNISMTIERGEVVGFLGANGAGKTTTLKMLTGLIHPSGGSIDIDGYNPFRRQPEFLHQITLVMGQKQQLIWDLPAMDSLRINAAVYDISDREFHLRVGELMEMLSLEGKLDPPVRKLSLGERMKAELMAALLHRPHILFLDEPTLGLDVNAQTSVRKFLKDYNDRYQATIMLTSHYMADITALCQRVILIHDGMGIYDGSLEGLMEKFAPDREVKLDLLSPVSDDRLTKYGTIASRTGQEVRLLVDRSTIAQTISQILAELPVSDLSVTEPPIEETIGKVFREGIQI